MGTSIIDIQRDSFLKAIKATSGNDWKVLVVDQQSRKLLNNVTKEDEVLNANITNIEQLEDKRQTQSDTDAIYLLSPQPFVAECLKADLSRKRYRNSFVIWTSRLPDQLRERLNPLRSQIANQFSLNIDFFPREANVITFRDPESFQILFNPSCNELIAGHLRILSQKIISLCVSLGENPEIRFYNPRNKEYHASVLCYHLANKVQEGLDEYYKWNAPPPESGRPRAALLITDRAMDAIAPLVHELSYQAMAMDLLSIQDNDDKITYKTIIRRGLPDQEEKTVELSENDNIWVENRHLHMKDLLIKLSNDFKKFMAKNSQFAGSEGDPVSVNTIKDMLAGLPEFQVGKEAFSVHIDMAEKCAKIFQETNMIDLISVEQSLSTGLDEDNRTPKNLADQVVRVIADLVNLDASGVNPDASQDNRIRLLVLYVLYRNGMLRGDIDKLCRHAHLQSGIIRLIENLVHLGARVYRELRDAPSPLIPLFPPQPVVYAEGEEMSLSRFEPAIKHMLEAQVNGRLDTERFGYTRRPDPSTTMHTPQQQSLRAVAAPTWARTRNVVKPKQRVIVFMAGGATYSEARACYEVSQQMQREVYLATTDMLSPKMFLSQTSFLGFSRQQLKLSMDKAPPPLPRWMSEPPPGAQRPEQQAQRQPNGPGDRSRPPVNAMQQMSLNPEGGQRPARGPSPARAPAPGQTGAYQSSDESGKLKKDKKDKKHGFRNMFR